MSKEEALTNASVSIARKPHRFPWMRRFIFYGVLSMAIRTSTSACISSSQLINHPRTIDEESIFLYYGGQARSFQTSEVLEPFRKRFCDIGKEVYQFLHVWRNSGCNQSSVSLPTYFAGGLTNMTDKDMYKKIIGFIDDTDKKKERERKIG